MAEVVGAAEYDNYICLGIHIFYAGAEILAVAFTALRLGGALGGDAGAADAVALDDGAGIAAEHIPVNIFLTGGTASTGDAVP